MKKHFVQCISIIVFLLLVFTTGCFDFISNFDIDPVVMRANPYIKKIISDDEELHSYALAAIQDCQLQNKVCILNGIYRFIVENYDYIPDPEDEEIIQTPQETIAKNGGDCEDLSILLISLLENVGLTCYLVLTDTHAYALAVDIDSDLLWHYVEESLIAQAEQDNNENIKQTFADAITLKPRSSWYYGGNGSTLSDSFESLTFYYNVTSTRPIDVYFVPSIQDFHSFGNDSSFYQFQSCRHLNKKEINDSCSMKTNGGIILSNDGFRSSSVTINIEQYFKPSFYSLFKNNTISSYMIDGKQCIVLDPTAGSYGYPGYDANVSGEKIAFNPISKDYVYLD